MMSPTHAAVRRSQLQLALANASIDGDILRLRRILSELTELNRKEFGHTDSGTLAIPLDRQGITSMSLRNSYDSPK